MIGIVQPDSGNITSICDSVARLGLDYRLLPEPQLDGITHLILPGQGRFGAVMRYLHRTGWADALTQWVADGKPLVGICVGLQVLFQSSAEDDDPGLGILPGRVEWVQAPKRPMMGWAPVAFNNIDLPDGDAYFVNSYVVPESEHAVATVTYGASFAAAVARDNVVAFQFHPEKSGAWGQEVLGLCLK
ncbi:imidazole glycerol phosphate synthase subunit HisH [Acanthopleuribacter pedis]|uniref:Imidazole glycerol phosphate synthase subunit HisH n=1 Tax=Acanthopleuribacter pedis TaxID=442870 RepID=A0A8J7QH24_9BACT|nr:imidazole glycerol phosphate synthase subunit HisH [Acanthopleuribacter pedis]MBO1320231.1 imidazole glycerol phosphate synthase subunit HisH [Acanthopleuribacter pedis]